MRRGNTSSMASSSSSSIVALILSLNILFFTCVSSTPCGPNYKPTPTVVPKLPPNFVPPPTIPTVPKATPTTPTARKQCRRDTLKLGACSDLLGGLVNLVIGPAGSSHCCSLLDGLADLDAAVCLCTVVKANVLGIKLNVPVSLSLLLNACGRVPPKGYRCA